MRGKELRQHRRDQRRQARDERKANRRQKRIERRETNSVNRKKRAEIVKTVVKDGLTKLLIGPNESSSDTEEE